MNSTQTPLRIPLSEDHITQEAAQIIHKHLGSDFKIFLFGSRAQGSARPNSDFDFGVQGPTSVPLRTILDIKSALESIRTLASFDVVDFSDTSEPFVRIAQQSARDVTPIT